jgi:ubiquinone/menaquinone biosynthesis C-methylase UbiE
MLRTETIPLIIEGEWRSWLHTGRSVEKENWMEPDRDPKEIVRTGYDRISERYRQADFNFEGSGYQQCLATLLPRLKPGSQALDLGCGCGVPVSRILAGEHSLTGVDISPVQIQRARDLVPSGEFVCADMTEVDFEAGQFDVIVSFFAIIHVPVAEHPALFHKLSRWLKPGGLLMFSVGHQAWTGTEPDWKGTEMYWSHADPEIYRKWLGDLGFEIVWETFLPEGDGGHPVILAKKQTTGEKNSPGEKKKPNSRRQDA